jgi:hypothetical protein
MPTVRPIRGKICGRIACLALALTGADRPDGSPGAAAPPARGEFSGFDLPDAWEERFWAQPGVRALLAQEPKALAAMVPTQAGLRFCRCPSCPADEVDDPLAWSPEQPEFLTCRRCGARFPNDKVPAKVLVKDPIDKRKDEEKVPEEVVEVLPGVVHRYPYHAVEPARQRYPDERIYLAAKRDYEAREFLAKAALYAAVRHHERPAGVDDAALARLAGVLLLRFAQVYPAYATHYDQPGQAKVFQQADLPPPYRLGYRTAKWDWSGALDVPVNLVIAYAMIRDDPALAEAGRQLGDPHPGRTIEGALFRAAAEFVRHQPETTDEDSLYADRGLLAVGLLLGDPALVREARSRLDAFARRCFYHDGLWRQADALAHRRVLGLVDGWIDGLLSVAEPDGDRGRDLTSMLALARSAAGAALTVIRAPEVQPASWPAPAMPGAPRRPVLLGGAGLARLAVGGGDEALDLELRGFGSLGGPRSDRLALRLAVGGRPALGDLDDLPPSPGGFERSTASHNAVAVDGLNQRETPVLARRPAPGADILFFAADPDFQVATLDDRHAFPRSTSRYRHTVVASAGAGACYAVSLFEVRGGLQHEQLFHAPAGSAARWRTPSPLGPGPRSLLPDSVAFLPSARAEDGRWFIQSFGAFSGLAQGRADRPFLAWLEGPGAPPLRVHVLGDVPQTIITGTSPDPSASSPSGADEAGRGVLVLRRRSPDGSGLETTFVTVFEAIGPRPGLQRVGRLESPPGTVVLLLETAAGTEHLVVNVTPGTRQTVRLSGGEPLQTDGLAVRETAEGLVLAGGTFARTSGCAVRQPRAEGTIRRAVRAVEGDARGWFEADAALPDPESLAGRALLVRHGDGTTRGWTIARAENTPEGRARLLVREEPGFQVDPQSRDAVYYQFPETRAPGPHHFRVARIAR